MELRRLWSFEDDQIYCRQSAVNCDKIMKEYVNEDQLNGKLLTSLISEESNIEVEDIIERYNLSEVRDSSGDTLLHFASKYNNVALTVYLIGLGCNVNAQNNLGQTPIMTALDKDNHEIIEEIVEILSKADADIYICDSNGKSALKTVLDYSTYKSPRLIKMFLERVYSDCQNNNELTAQRLLNANCSLEQAIYLNNSEVTKIMIEHGCSVHTRHPQKGRTPLHMAVQLMDQKNVELLIKCGANVNARDIYGERPLGYYNLDLNVIQRPEIIEILMKKGALLNKCGRKGRIPVYCMLRYGTKETIQTLFQYDIDLAIKKDTLMCGGNLLHVLALNVTPGVTSLLTGKKLDVNARNMFGQTALFNAVVSKNRTMAQFLVDEGCDINARDMAGETPLTYACRHIDRTGILEILLQNGANIQNVNSFLKTPFHVILQNVTFILAKPIIAHLVMSEELGKPINEFIRSTIDSHEMFRNHFQLCKRRIEKMKKTVVHGNVTLYELLTENEDILARHCVCNDVLMTKLMNMNRKCHRNYYYFGIMRRRIADIVGKIQNSASNLCRIMEWPLDTNHIIVREVVKCLDFNDLTQLNKV